jgi:histidinol-phosphate phosphatase family protein
MTSPPPTSCGRAVFLDRDGTINADRPDYIKTPREFSFLPRATAALRILGALELKIIVATNQSAVGRGIVSFETATEINRQMIDAVYRQGGRITDIYMCPHAPEDRCGCRKPKPGLLVQAAREHAIDLCRSFMIGDRHSDLEAGKAVGCNAILIGKQDVSVAQDSLVVVSDLYEAAQYIALRSDSRSNPVAGTGTHVA